MERNKISSSKYAAIHYWIRKNYGFANRCESKDCQKKSEVFEWAKLREKEYDFNRDNFMQLCRSCHHKYDCTEETREKLRKFNAGKTLSKKHRQKISKTLMGHPVSEAQREKHKRIKVVPVEQLLDGKVIRTFYSQREAARHMGIKSTGICAALREGHKAKGFDWRRATTKP